MPNAEAKILRSLDTVSFADLIPWSCSGGLHVANWAVVFFAVGYGAAAVLTKRAKAAKVVGTELLAPRAAAAAPPSTAREALAGVRIAGVAMAPLGMALGVLISQTGLPWWTALLFTGVIFAGSLEFLLIGMVASPHRWRRWRSRLCW